MTPFDPPPDDVPLPQQDAPLALQSDVEHLQKHLHELQARLREQTHEVQVEKTSIQEQCVYLRKLLLGTQVALILLTLGTCLFTFKQMRTVRYLMDLQRPTISQNLGEFHSRFEPKLRKLLSNLQDFAAKNADFQPIFDRHRALFPQYLSTIVPALPAVSPVATNAPAAP